MGARGRESGIVALVMACAAFAYAEPIDGGQGAFEADAGAAYLCGPIQGHLQTPRDGEPAMTSRHRPRLDELGIDQTRTGDIWLNLSYDLHGLYFGVRLTDLSERDTLDSPLLSQGQTFPAGARVDSDVRLDWYRLGYRYHIPIDWDGRPVEIYPSIGVTLFDSRYRLSNAGPEDVGCSYVKAGIQAGLAGVVPLTHRLSLSAQALVPIPFSASADIFSSQLEARYILFADGTVGLTGLVGIGYDTIRYRDNQTVSNDIKVDMGPLLILGLEATF
jgi:hypothetical protein